MNKKIIAVIPMLLLAASVIADECPEGYTAELTETLAVPCGPRTVVTTSNDLSAGVQYIFEASGTCNWRTPGSASGYLADAEYWLRNDQYGTGWTKMNPGSIAIWNGASAVNIDWGDYSAANIYYEAYTPLATGTVSFLFYDDQYSDNSGSLTVKINECKLDRTAEITSPEAEASITDGCSVDFDAYLIDDDYDAVQWAVRKGTCAAGTNTVFGNVDGFSNPFDWIFDGEYTYNFHAETDVSDWDAGSYCFVFNPTEDAGETNIRLTREFAIADSDEDGVNDCQDYCADTEADILKASLGTNRWMWNGEEFQTLSPKGKGPQKSYTIEQTNGCGCTQILAWLNNYDPVAYGAMEGHWKFGCSISVMDEFVSLMAEE